MNKNLEERLEEYIDSLLIAEEKLSNINYSVSSTNHLINLTTLGLIRDIGYDLIKVMEGVNHEI